MRNEKVKIDDAGVRGCIENDDAPEKGKKCQCFLKNELRFNEITNNTLEYSSINRIKVKSMITF